MKSASTIQSPQGWVQQVGADVSQLHRDTQASQRPTEEIVLQVGVGEEPLRVVDADQTEWLCVRAHGNIRSSANPNVGGRALDIGISKAIDRDLKGEGSG